MWYSCCSGARCAVVYSRLASVTQVASDKESVFISFVLWPVHKEWRDGKLPVSWPPFPLFKRTKCPFVSHFYPLAFMCFHCIVSCLDECRGDSEFHQLIWRLSFDSSDSKVGDGCERIHAKAMSPLFSGLPSDLTHRMAQQFSERQPEREREREKSREERQLYTVTRCHLTMGEKKRGTQNRKEKRRRHVKQKSLSHFQSMYDTSTLEIFTGRKVSH